MELPPYRMPTLQSILILMWEKTAMYLQKAGTIILFASIILFVINTYPVKARLDGNYDARIASVEASALPAAEKSVAISNIEAERNGELLEYSTAGRIGRALETVLRPVGFDWRVSSALIGAFAAKELFVAQLGILYAVGENDASAETLREKLRNNYTPLQGFCIMLFCLLTVPCIATVAVVRRESGSWKFTLAQIGLYTLTAYVLTLLVFQAGMLFNIGTRLLS